MAQAQNLAILLSLQNVGQVINGINSITQAWANQGRNVTKNMNNQIALMNQIIETQGKVAQSAVIASNKQSLAIDRSQGNISQLVGIIGNLTTAWTTSGSKMTKSRQGVLDTLERIIAKEAEVSETALVTGNKTQNQNKKNANSTLEWAVKIGAVTAALVGLNNMLGKVAGSFSILGKAAGGIGAGIGGLAGLIAGGPAGAAAGGALGGGIGGIIGNIAGAFFNIPFMFYKTIAKGVGTVVGSVLNGIKSIGGALNNLVFGPVSLFSLAMGSTFKNMADGLTETIKAIWTASEEFQKLTISIETLTRREIARSRGIDISAVSSREYLGVTQELFAWLTKVSLTSPFTMKSIADAMKFASAMGLSIETTKSLTLATGNFSAAMGLTEDHQYRIMYNLAQIYQQGKLTGREFRDLAISFVPVYDILGVMAKEAGMSTEAFKKLALEGGVPVEEFFEHFISYMETNFPDAMKRMARTMEGVRNNIKDFIQVVMGMELLGPVMNEISGRLADVLDKLMTPTMHNIAKDFGYGLARAFKQIEIGVNTLGDSIKNLLKILGFVKPTVDDVRQVFVQLYLNARYALEFIAHTIDTIANAIKTYVIPQLQAVGLLSGKGFTWGAGFIKSFAEGIIVGVAKFLAKAIVYVTAFIKAFFSTNSPPEVAPDIDKWGAGMMDAWIEGAVNQTNWNALGTGVGDKIGGQLYDLGRPNPPVMGTIETGPEGTPEEDWQNSLKKTVKEGVSAVSRFVTEQGLKLAAAFMKGFKAIDFDILDAIQSPLKSAIDALTNLGMIGKVAGIEMLYDISTDLIAAIDEFNKSGVISEHLIGQISQLGMGLGQELADLVRAEFDLARASKEAADAQDRLNAATKALTDAQLGVRKLVREYNAMLRAGADKSTLKVKLGEVNAAERAWGAAEKEKDAAEENKKLADERLEQMKEVASLQEKLVSNMIELLNMQNDAMQAASSGAGSLSDTIDELLQNLGTSVSDSIFNAFTDWEDIENKYPGIKTFWDGMAESFASAFNAEINNVNIQKSADDLMERFKNAIRDVLGMGEEIVYPSPLHPELLPTPEPGEIIPPAAGMPVGGSFFQQVVDKLFSGTVDWSAAIGKVTDALVTIVSGALGKLLDKINNPDDPLHKVVIDGAVNLAWSFVKSFWGAVGDQIAQGIESKDFSVEDFNAQYESIYGEKPPADLKPIDFQVTFNLVPDDIITKGEEAGTGVAQGMSDGMTAFDWLATIAKVAWNIWTEFTEGFDMGSPAKYFIPIGEAVVEGIANGITSFVSSIIGPDGAIAKAAKDIINAFKKFLGISTDNESTSSIFETIGNAVTQGIANGIQAMDDAIQSAIDWVVSILPEWAKKLLNITSPSKVMMKIGQSAMEGFALGITSMSELVKKAAAEVSVTTPELALSRPQYRPFATKSVGSISKVNNVTLGDVYINNNMDWATFKSRVQRAITER